MKALQCHAMRAAIYVVPLIVGLFGGAGIAAAQQPTPEQQDAIRSNCRSDFMANCSGVPRGGKEAMQCLKDNVAKLSSGCQQAVKAVMPAPAPKPPTPVTATPAAPAAPPSAAAPAAPVAATPAAPAAPAAASAASTATQAAPTPTAAKPAAAPTASTPQAAAAKPASVKPAAPAAQAAKSAAKPPAGAPVPAAAPPAVIVVAPIQVFALVRTKCRAEYRAYCSDVDIGGGRVVACLQANAASLSPTCQSGLAELGR
jgi:hypothetical protein